MELHSRYIYFDAVLLGMAPNQSNASYLNEEQLTKSTRSLTLTLERAAWFISKIDRLEAVIDAVD
jgi:hypothetical protein